MKLLILLLCLSWISCEREVSSPKEVVYFHISVSGNPFVASVTLDKPAESDFFVLFDWFDTDMLSHNETLNVKTGETYAETATGVDSTGYMRGVQMVDWTKESDHYIYAPNVR